MAELVGLSAIAGYQVQIDSESQATAEERLGNTADPRHGERGEQAKPYPWESKAGQAGEHGPYGPENQMLGDEWWFYQPAGDESEDPSMDHTPLRRAAPYPKGVNSGPIPGATPDDIADQLTQSYAIHGHNNNAGYKALHNPEAQNDEWVSLEEVNSGSSDLQALPRQAMSSGFMWGTRSREHSMARQNEFGFDSKHMKRRYAVGPIPGNTMWMLPGGRPMAKSLPGPARPAIGVDSPFAGQDLGQAFGANGATLQNVPTEYATPPQVNLASSTQDYVNDSVVEWY
jgi:hypothetical protein